MCAPTRRPASEGFVDQIESSPDPIALDGELRCRRGQNDAVLRTAVQAAPQVISRETRLDPELDASAVRGERHCARIVAHQRVDVGLGGRDPLGLGEGEGLGH